MQQTDEAAFKQLFRDACRRCFGRDLTVPLSATESKHLCARILEETGGVIGSKTVQNYSLHIHLDYIPDETRRMHPTGATLETLARYVLWAPPRGRYAGGPRRARAPRDTTRDGEASRVEGPDAAVGEGAAARFPLHTPRPGGRPSLLVPLQTRLPAPTACAYPQQRPALEEAGVRTPGRSGGTEGTGPTFFLSYIPGRGTVPDVEQAARARTDQAFTGWPGWPWVLFSGLIVVWSMREYYYRKTSRFTDTFAQVEGDSLYSRGWIRHYPDSTWWARREEEKGSADAVYAGGEQQLAGYCARGEHRKPAHQDPDSRGMFYRGGPVLRFYADRQLATGGDTPDGRQQPALQERTHLYSL